MQQQHTATVTVTTRSNSVQQQQQQQTYHLYTHQLYFWDLFQFFSKLSFYILNQLFVKQEDGFLKNQLPSPFCTHYQPI